jgi:hypothetical protein
MLELLTVLGGLALFLFGVKMLSQGMEQLAGGKIQQWLDKATNHPIKGATFGAVATALVQSSGLLMVTMIGLINARLLPLENAIGVMLGQEIGTTITGQLVAFNIGNVRFVAVAVVSCYLNSGKSAVCSVMVNFDGLWPDVYGPRVHGGDRQAASGAPYGSRMAGVHGAYTTLGRVGRRRLNQYRPVEHRHHGPVDRHGRGRRHYLAGSYRVHLWR